MVPGVSSSVGCFLPCRGRRVRPFLEVQLWIVATIYMKDDMKHGDEGDLKPTHGCATMSVHVDCLLLLLLLLLAPNET